MKKLISLTVLAAAIVGVAAAQGSKTPTTIGCAVMPSNKVDIAKATKNKMFADYKGKRFFFCCAGCPSAFKKEPAKYAKGPSIPTPKATKPSK
jgi:YHS domain-containing protein